MAHAVINPRLVQPEDGAFDPVKELGGVLGTEYWIQTKPDEVVCDIVQLAPGGSVLPPPAALPAVMSLAFARGVVLDPEAGFGAAGVDLTEGAAGLGMGGGT